MKNKTTQANWAIILCGGRGSRLGNLTQDIPKPLIHVGGKAILHHIFDQLIAGGFNRLVLPVGFLGKQIEDFVNQYPFPAGVECFIRDTGRDTPIGSRLAQIRNFLPDEADILMTNGDLIFDFDLQDFLQNHQHQNNCITFASTTIRSPFGLLMFDGDNLRGFSRDDRISSFNKCDDSDTGRVYSGICIFNTRGLDFDKVEHCENFEVEIFPELISSGRAGHYSIEGFWHPIDTQKDLNTVNALLKDARPKNG